MNDVDEMIARFERKYPELMLVEQGERAEVLAHANPRLMMWLRNACALLLTIPLMIGTTLFTIAYGYLPAGLPKALTMFVSAPFVLLFAVLYVWLFPGWRKRMRAAMIDRGVPICIHCAEHLAVSVSKSDAAPTRCPRCRRILPTHVINILLGRHERSVEMVRIRDEARLSGLDFERLLAYSKTGEDAMNACVSWRRDRRQSEEDKKTLSLAVFVGFALIAVTGVTVASLIGWLLPPFIPWLVAAVVVSGVFSVIVSSLVLIKSPSRFIREHFSARGVPLCRKCPHDFRGSRVEPVPGTPCPRCGEPLGKADITPDPPPSLTLDEHERPIYGDT